MSFPNHQGSFLPSVVWNPKHCWTAPGERAVLVMLHEWAAGDSLTVSLTEKGFSAKFAADIFAARGCLAVYNPHAILLDTRVGASKNYDFVKELSVTERPTPRLLIALSGFSLSESVENLKRAGYDGHSRRPCPVWQIRDLLDNFFNADLPAA